MRVDLLEDSVLREIEKLSRRREVIAAIVQNYVQCNRTKWSELEGKKQELQERLRRLAEEKTNLSRWLLGNDLSADAVRYINTQVDTYNDKENELLAQVWHIEDEIGAIELMNFNVETVSDYLRDFCRSYAELETPGERKLLMESLVQRVVIGPNKKAALTLRPPLLGFITPTLARRGEKPKIGFTICIEYSLADYYRGLPNKTMVLSSYSATEYIL
jgi:hypothetical protein